MAKKSRGLNTAKALIKRRSKSLWASQKYKSRTLRLREKSDPLEGASQGKGIILEKVQREAQKVKTGFSQREKKAINISGILIQMPLFY